MDNFIPDSQNIDGKSSKTGHALATSTDNNYDAPSETLTPTQNNKRKLIFIGLALVLVSGVLATLYFANKKAPAVTPTTSKVKVRLNWVNNPQFTGMYIAADKGFYAAEGLDVTLMEAEDSTDVNKEVADGVVDYGVSTPLEIILARDGGKKVKGIAAIFQTSAYSIVTKKSASIKTPSDFKGKVLGGLGDNNQAKVTYAALISNAGLQLTDAVVKGVDFDVVKVFTENQADSADIYRTDQTYLLDQAHVPYDQLFPEQFGFAIYGDTLIASDKTISTNPSQTKAFVKATLKGWQYAIDHEAEALVIVKKHANELYKDPAYVKFGLSGTLPLIKTTGNLPLGSMQFVPWNRAYEGVQQSGQLKTSFDPADAYTSEFVK